MQIRQLTTSDKTVVLDMMRTFYTSQAVHTNGSNDIFLSDIDACLDADNCYLEGYVFKIDNQTIGYAMLAKSFSTEFGKPCVWIEDIYLKEGYRNQGLGGQFLDFVSSKYQNSIIRLELDKDNTRALRAYQKGGFEELSYLEMIKNHNL